MSLVTEVLYASGTIYKNPTGTASTLWGTNLGETEKGFMLYFDRQLADLVVSEHAEISQSKLEIDSAAHALVTFTRWNTETKKLLFGENRVSTTGLVQIPNTVKAGDSVPCASYLFVPDRYADTTYAGSDICVYIPRGQAYIPSGEYLNMSKTRSLFPIEIYCSPANVTSTHVLYNGRCLQIGAISQLNITSGVATL